ncbi:MAG: hypothetical protein Q8O37_08330 [Sulfuricellaceae bacterium]|nr:hypothetical protein [Sulfuricellaceae bacterium]
MSSDESNILVENLTTPVKHASIKLGMALVVVVAVLVVIALGAGMWFLKERAVDEMQRSLAAEKTRLASDMEKRVAQATAAAQRSAQDSVTNTRKIWLMTMSKPLLWAMRQSVLASNIGEIDAYVVELVRNPVFDRIVMTSREGMVVVASDRKMLDVPIDAVYPAAVKDAQEPAVLNGEGGKLILVIPIMGASEKLGIFAMTYDPAAPPKPAPVPTPASTDPIVPPAAPGLVPVQ